MINNQKGWLLVALSSSLYIYDFILRVSAGVLAFSMMSWLHFDALSWSIISSMFYYGYALMQIPAGLLIDHYGARRTLIGCSIIGTLAAWSTLHFNSFEALIISRFIMGMASSVAYVGPLVIARTHLPLNAFALAAGLIQVLGCLGAITGTALILTVLNAFHLQKTLQLITIIGAIISILFIAFIPKDAHDEQKTATSWQHEWLTLKNVFTMRSSYLTGFLALSLWCPIIVFLENWGITWLQLIGHHESHAMLTMTIGWLVIAIGGPLAGWLSTKYQTRKNVIIAGLTLNIIGTSLWLIAPQYLGLSLIAIVLFSLGSASQCITFAVIADSHAEDRIGTAIGMNNMFIISSGFSILPLVGSWIKNNATATIPDQISNFIGGQSLILIVLGIALALTLFVLKETYHDQ